MYPIKVKLLTPMEAKDYPWLHRDLKEGEEFFVYQGSTYGCISKTGIAVTEDLNKTPYFEVPKEFVVYINKD